jgi:hypothetical protein
VLFFLHAFAFFVLFFPLSLYSWSFSSSYHFFCAFAFFVLFFLALLLFHALAFFAFFILCFFAFFALFFLCAFALVLLRACERKPQKKHPASPLDATEPDRNIISS